MMDGERLISEVFSRPPLWQSSHKHYKIRALVEKNWDDVAMEMISTKDEVRARWKSLRDYYRKELKKTLKFKTGDDEDKVQKSTWPYFDHLSFLKEEMTSPSTLGNCTTEEVHLTTAGDYDYSDTIILNDVIAEELGEGNDRHSSGSISSSEKSTRKRKANVQQEAAKRMLQIEGKQKEMMQNEIQEHCEDYHFFMSLLPHFKDIPPLEKLNIRNNIIQLIIDSKNVTTPKKNDYVKLRRRN